MNELKRNGSGCYDPTAYNAIKNFMMGEEKMEVYRGDIFYIRKGGYTTGSEQEQGRPAVIVSNDIGNKYSQIYEVVYLTSQEKKPLPTHVPVMCKVPSTAMCEQITNVSQDRLGNFVRTCTDEEMEAIDRALAISLGIDLTEVQRVNNQEIDNLKMKLEGAERMLDEEKAKHLEEKTFLEKHNKELICRLEEIAEKEHLQTVLDAAGNQNEETTKLTTERNLYKKLYEQTLERLIG